MEINSEVCKPIPDFSRYVISETGRIYRVIALNNKEREALKSNPERLYVRESKIQNYPQGTRGRWNQVGLIKDGGIFVTVSPENLLCTAFELWPEKKQKIKIQFKDGNTQNIHIDNIEFVARTPSNSKLTKNDVVKIRRLITLGQPLRHIGVTFGVSEMQINRIKTGENWRRGGRKVPPPKAPFKIEDGRMHRFLASFEYSEIDKNIRRPFTIKRTNNPNKNKIIGTLNGYRFTKEHGNISRARALVFKLNQYFFNEDIAIKSDQKIPVKAIKKTDALYRK